MISSKGRCSVLKVIQFLREVTPLGRVVHHILPPKYQLASSQYSLDAEPDNYTIYREPTKQEQAIHIVKNKVIKLQHHFSFFEVCTKVLDIGIISVEDSFGHDDEFVDLIHDNTNSSRVSIVADTAVELISIPKELFYEYVTSETQDVITPFQYSNCS